MFTVAIIGADGAGKSTVTRQAIQQLTIPSKYIYMGVNLESSNLVLPTTRLYLEFRRLRGGRPDMLGPPDPTRAKPKSKHPIKRFLSTAKTSLRLTNLMAEEWFRQCLVWLYQKRGNIVIFDRHFFIDYYAHDIAGGKNIPLPNRVHGWMLKRFYPRPDLVIMLDAPPEVLFARKQEGSIELLEVRRQEYLYIQNVIPDFYEVDATQTLEVVTTEVIEIIENFIDKQLFQLKPH